MLGYWHNLIHKKRYWIPFFFLLVFVLYLPSINGEFIADDIPVIAQSHTIGTMQSVVQNPFAMIQSFIYLLIYSVTGATPFLFHLSNILFHLSSVLVLFRLVAVLHNRQTGFLAATLFAVHPLVTESVSWISGAPYVEYGFFLITSFYFFVQYDKHKKGLWWSVFFFFLALETTDKPVIFPAILVAYILTYGSLKKLWLSVIPFIALSGIWAVHILMVIPARMQLAKNVFGNTSYVSSPAQIILMAVSAYLALFFWPATLSFTHSSFVVNTQFYIEAGTIIGIYLLAVIASAFKYRPLTFWLLFMPLSLAPTLTSLKISWIVAERYAYLTTAGLSVSVALIILFLQKKFPRFTKPLFIIFGIVVICLSMRTFVRNMDWASAGKIWLSTVKSEPASTSAYTHLGIVYKNNKQYADAERAFKKSLEINPHYVDAHFNLADLYVKEQKYDLALQEYQAALSLNPTASELYQGIGAVYYMQRDYKNAIAYTQKSLELKPSNTQLYVNLIVMYLQANEKPQAQQLLNKIKTLGAPATTVENLQHMIDNAH